MWARGGGGGDSDAGPHDMKSLKNLTLLKQFSRAETLKAIISPNHLQWPQTAYRHTQVITAVSDLYFCCLNQHILILHEGRMFSHTKSYMIMYLQY